MASPDFSPVAGERGLGDDAAVFDLDEELSQATQTRYPAVTEKEEIIWAGWDQLVESDSIQPRWVPRSSCYEISIDRHR